MTAIPAAVESDILARQRTNWTGKLVLNFKDGRIIAYDVTESKRLQQETHVSPAPRGQTHDSRTRQA